MLPSPRDPDPTYGVDDGEFETAVALADNDPNAIAQEIWIETTDNLAQGDAYGTPDVNAGAITFRRSIADDELTVSYAVSGTAGLDTDYTIDHQAGPTMPVPGAITFPAGVDRITVAIVPTTLAAYPGSKSATLTLTSGSGYATKAAALAGTVDVYGSDGSGQPYYFVTMAGADGADDLPLASEDGGSFTLTLTYATFMNEVPLLDDMLPHFVGGTAVLGTDYTMTQDVVTTYGSWMDPEAQNPPGLPGGKTVTYTITPIDDDVWSGDKTVELIVPRQDKLALFIDIGASPNGARGRILEDDAETPTVSISAPDPVANEDPTTTGLFRLERTDEKLAYPLKVYVELGGDATYGDDYALDALSSDAEGTYVTFAAGQKEIMVELTPYIDQFEEDVEDAQIQIKESTQYLIGTIYAAVYITANNLYNNPIDIDTDIDRDGLVHDMLDEPREEDNGTIVIADKEGVYQDPDEPARLRRIEIRNRINSNQVWLKRSSDSVRLFNNQNPAQNAADLFGNNDEIQIAPGTYYLKGGATPSQNNYVTDHHLKVGAVQGTYTDKIGITVLWVELTAKMLTTENLSPNPVFDGTVQAKFAQTQAQDTPRTSTFTAGTDSLGVRRSKSQYVGRLFPHSHFVNGVENLTWKRTWAIAPIEFLLHFPRFPASEALSPFA